MIGHIVCVMLNALYGKRLHQSLNPISLLVFVRWFLWKLLLSYLFCGYEGKD